MSTEQTIQEFSTKARAHKLHQESVEIPTSYGEYLNLSEKQKLQLLKKEPKTCEVCGVGKIGPTVFCKRNRQGCPLCGALYHSNGKLDKRYMPSQFHINWAKNHPELA